MTLSEGLFQKSRSAVSASENCVTHVPLKYREFVITMAVPAFTADCTITSFIFPRVFSAAHAFILFTPPSSPSSKKSTRSTSAR